MDKSSSIQKVLPTDDSGSRHPVISPSVSKKVRVRLLIAFPLLVVLIVSIVSGAFYQMVETEFGSPGLTTAAKGFASERLSAFARKWIIAMLLMDVAGAAIGFAAAYSITEPIRRIISLSQRVAAGNFSERAQLERPDDLGALGHSFDEMVESLNRFISLRNRFILESFTGGLITLDIHGTVTAINSAAEKMLSLNAGVAVGRPIHELLTSPTYAPLRSVIEESLWKQKDVRLRKLILPTGEQPLALCVHTAVMRDRAGNAFGIMVNLRDLQEWERFYKQMARTDQLAALGTFAAGLTHEIRNPLGAIRGLAQLLEEDPTLPAKAHQYLRVIIQETERLDVLVREVQEFSAASTVEPTSHDVSAAVRKAVLMARNNPNTTLAEGVELLEHYTEELRAPIAEEKFIQALMNILVNAIQATPPGGRITVQTKRLTSEPLPIEIGIENTGSQIPVELLDRVFEPFFTTKERGTGLGLSIAYQILKQHGGEVRIANTDVGVRATIRLPEASVG